MSRHGSKKEGGRKWVQVSDSRSGEAKEPKMMETTGLDFNDFLQMLHQAMQITWFWRGILLNYNYYWLTLKKKK